MTASKKTETRASKQTKQKRPSIITIGGGTGSFTVLQGLKAHPVALTAVVTMADDGGSTGLLRDELGVLPPGDLRQCLVALSRGNGTMRELFTHRFDRGTLKGHNVGNLLISALEQITGDFGEALEKASLILNVEGRVLPVTLDDITLCMELENGKKFVGEQAITNCGYLSRYGVRRMYLKPAGTLNPKVKEALRTADLIVVGPGNLYSSVLPNFLVSGMVQAMRQSKATKVLVANLVNKYGQQDGFTPGTYARTFQDILGARLFDVLVYNTGKPAPALVRRYKEEGEPVVFSKEDVPPGIEAIGADILAGSVPKSRKGDAIAATRAFIRHDPEKLARVLVNLLHR